MSSLNNRIDTWIFDLDNTLYSADSGIFQQVHELMGKFVSNHLNIGINEAKKIQKKYYKEHGTTLKGLMDNHGVEPDYFLAEVHKLDYSIVNSNKNLNNEFYNLGSDKTGNLYDIRSSRIEKTLRQLFEDCCSKFRI